MDDIFTADPATNLELGFNDLVGEDKKYKEPDALAKAYANLERHARTLEAENAAARAERDALQATTNNHSNPSELNGQAPSQQPDPAPVTPPNNSPTPKDDDFRSQIKEQIRAMNDEDRAKANMDEAARQLVTLFGSEAGASDAIRKRANELGVSVEWLRDSASRSPSAFYATMGVSPNTTQDRSTPSPNPQVRMTNDSGTKNFEYYDKIRRDDPKLYFTPRIQTEMLQAAKTVPDFYKR